MEDTDGTLPGNYHGPFATQRQQGSANKFL